MTLPPRRTTPSAVEREARKIANRAKHHAGVAVPPRLTAAEKLEAIDRQLATLAKTTDGLEQARILDIRGRVVDVQDRIESKTPPAEEQTPEELEAMAVTYLEGRGAVVTWPGRQG